MSHVEQVIPQFYLTLLRSAKEGNLAISLANVQQQIRTILEVSHLYEIFPILSEEMAVESEEVAKEAYYGSIS